MNEPCEVTTIASFCDADQRAKEGFSRTQASRKFVHRNVERRLYGSYLVELPDGRKVRMTR